jgi:hypothetical protein
MIPNNVLAAGRILFHSWVRFSTIACSKLLRPLWKAEYRVGASAIKEWRGLVEAGEEMSNNLGAHQKRAINTLCGCRCGMAE